MVQDRIYNYFERNLQLHVLFIFDRMNIIQTELDEMKQWADNYIYKVFNGAWFNTKYAIENEWRDKWVVLLFLEHVYPHTEEQQLSFPLLDMMKANMEYKEDNYAAYMKQYGLPEKFRGFVKKNISEIMSSKVSNILNGHLNCSSFSEDLEAETGKFDDCGAELSTKETKQLQQLDECHEYHDRLRVVAEQAISFDLEDGVIVNYAKLGDVEQKIK